MYTLLMITIITSHPEIDYFHNYLKMNVFLTHLTGINFNLIQFNQWGYVYRPFIW
jgi:hypothetical protein